MKLSPATWALIALVFVLLTQIVIPAALVTLGIDLGTGGPVR